jgi:TetR/AcrR family transcriptional regulator
VVKDGLETAKIMPIDPNHFFIMLWATTRFYADFAEVVAVTLEKGRLSLTDYEAARTGADIDVI